MIASPSKLAETNVQITYRPYANLPQWPILPEYGDGDTEESRFYQNVADRVTKGYMATMPSGRKKYINPAYFFFTNCVKMPMLDPVTEQDTVASPLFYDTHERLSNLLWNSRYIASSELGGGLKSKNAEDLIAAKGRRKGWSEYMLRGHLLHAAVVLHQNIGIGLDTETSRDDAKTKFMSAYESLPDFFKQYDIVVNTKERVVFGEWVETNTSQRRYRIINTVYFYGMDKVFDKFRGLALSIIFLDEIGKFTNLMKVVTASTDCLKKGIFKIGQFILGGTSDAINNKTTDYRDLYREAKAGKRKGWVNFFICSDEITDGCIDVKLGISLRDKARAAYMQNREDKKHNPAEFYQEICENPLDDEEGFLGGGGASYDRQALNGQQLWLLETGKHTTDLFTGKLQMEQGINGRPTGRVKVVEDSEAISSNEKNVNRGPWTFYRPAFTPRPDIAGMDLMTVDDFYFDEVKYSDSMGAILIYRSAVHFDMESDLPIAVYHFRPGSRRLFFYECYKAMLFWGCDAFIENNDEALVAFLKKFGLGPKLQKVDKRYGIKNTEKTIATQEVLGQEYLEEMRHERIYFPSILEALKTARTINNDIRSVVELMWMFLDLRGKDPVLMDKQIEEEATRYTGRGRTPRSAVRIGPQAGSPVPTGRPDPMTHVKKAVSTLMPWLRGR